MDAVRSTVRLITQAALITVAVTDHLTVAVVQCAVDRADRISRPRENSSRARDREKDWG
jgi:hypothetical protein